MVELRFMVWRVLEPGRKVERRRLRDVAAVVQPTGDGREVAHAYCDVLRLLSKQIATLVLRELPPVSRFPDRHQRRVC